MNCDYCPYLLPRKPINGALAWGHWCAVPVFLAEAEAVECVQTLARCPFANDLEPYEPGLNYLGK